MRHEGPFPQAAEVRDRGPLRNNQRTVLSEFYKLNPKRVIFTKSEREEIWKKFKKDGMDSLDHFNIEQQCPALFAELVRSVEEGHLIQSAIFSECTYAETYSQMLGLTEFSNFRRNPDCLESEIISLLDQFHLKPRYVYRAAGQPRLLVQAGGPGGIDCALVSLREKSLIAIEFKEPSAKTTEPDLPPYGEDGFLTCGDEFFSRYPQFEPMLTEQVKSRLNFWEVMGTNVNNFSPDSIRFAVVENYSGVKHADAIATEDRGGLLTMIPANQISEWATTKGEIRPAGRNSYKVWTPRFLASEIQRIGKLMSPEIAEVPLTQVNTSSARGGNGAIARYKLNSIFYVRAAHVVKAGDSIRFRLDKVSQLRPTISAHMFFRDLSHAQVQEHYRSEF